MKYLTQFRAVQFFVEKILAFSFVGIFLIFILALAYFVFKPSPPASSEKVSPLVWFEPVATTEYNTASFVSLASQIPNFTNANWQPASLPIMQELPSYVNIAPDAPMSRVWLSFDYKIPSGFDVSHGVALYGTRIMGGSYAIYINDQLVFDNRHNWRMQWNHPLFFQIPYPLLKNNDVVKVKIAVPYKNALGYAVGSIYIGDVEKLRGWSEIRYVLCILIPWWSGFVLLIFGFISFHLYLAKVDEKTNGLFFATSVAYFICNLQFVYDVSSNEKYSLWYGSIVDSATSWFVVLSAMYILRLSKKQYPRIKNIAYSTAVLMSIVTLPLWNWNASALILQHYVNIFLIVGVGALLIYRSVVEKNTYLRLLTASLWLLILGGLHDITYMTSHVTPDRFWIFSFVSIPFMLSFVFILQRSYVETYKLTLQHNKIMAETLEKQKLMLSQQQAQIVSQEKLIAIASERDRFMRDIHDGIGGILISTLRAVENDQPIAHISDMIKDCLVDLENIILSLEPNEKDLTVLLGSLRQKLHKRLDKTGVKIDWYIDDLPDVDGLDATASLSVLRIIQESITNALKHSQCTTITVSAKVVDLPSEEKIRITIADDGIGFSESSVAKSSGLKNMRYRADHSGFTLSLSSSPKGALVTVEIPVAIRCRQKGVDV